MRAILLLLLGAQPPIAATRSDYSDSHGPCDVGGKALRHEMQRVSDPLFRTR
jgi:hypothetical protein